MRHTLPAAITALALCAGLAAAPGHLTAQRAATPAGRLEEATHHELVLGDLERAITLYREVVAQRPADRSIAARALANMGRAYEKLGSREARIAYERLVREYADQVEPVRFARTRLESLAPATSRSGPVRTGATTLVFADLPTLRPRDDAQHDFSPGGDRVVYRLDVRSDSVTGVALMVTTSGGAVTRTLVPATHRMGISSPRWSPDGKHIAFLRRAFLEDSAYQAVIVVPAEGGPARVLADSTRARVLARGGLLWLPDSRGITVATDKGLLTIDLAGRVVRDVPLQIRYLSHVTGYSPDGRWIAMHRRPEGSQQTDEMDVWLQPAAGGRGIQVTHAPGFDGWAHWAENGRTLYFVSDRNGSHNVWKVEVDPVSGLPRSEPAQVTNYSGALILHPRTVDGGRKLAFTLVRETGAVHVGPTATPAAGKIVARGSRSQLAPDGQTAFFVGQGEDGRGIFAVSADGGTATRLSTTRPGGNEAFQPFAIAPDGTTIAYFSRIGNDNVLYVVPTPGGTPREITRFESNEDLVPSWSPDSRQLAYTHENGLFSIPAAGGAPEKRAHLYAWDGWTLRWSPDGAHLAALAWEAPNRPNAVFVVPASGGDPRRLTPPEETGYKEGLEWHPDSQRLSYMYYGLDDRSDGSRMAYLDGRPTTSLVDLPGPQWDYVGLWSPGGEYYFISARDRAWELYAHDERASASRLIVERDGAEPGVGGVPGFSRDGRRMTWTLIRTTRQLWTVDLAP